MICSTKVLALALALMPVVPSPTSGWPPVPAIAIPIVATMIHYGLTPPK